MADPRTATERAADSADLAAFNLASQIAALAELTQSPPRRRDLQAALAALFGVRRSVRALMCAADVKRTADSMGDDADA